MVGGVTALPRLYLSHDTGLDWLMAYEFGRVDDAQRPDCWRGVSEHFGFLHDSPGGRVVGFKVQGFAEFDPEDPEVEEIWRDPLFDAPLVGLANASAGEIVLAARTYFDGGDSVNRLLFQAATQVKGREAVEAWRRCLEAGDAMAHFALGYTLYELGDHAQAYRHLRHYTEIAPHSSWIWCWYGRAAEAVGELVEARRAYRRALELEEAGDDETDARERVAALSPAPTPPTSSAPTRPNRVVLWGDELPQLGRRRVEGLSPRLAAGLTAGAKGKAYKYTDPNEDAVAIVEGDESTLLVCADGHNGIASMRAAMDVVLELIGGEVPSPADLGDEMLVEMWYQAGEAVIAAGKSSRQPESRTTLVVAVAGRGQLRWAAMGDSFLAIVEPDSSVRKLGKRRSHFVGWPMTPAEVSERLPEGLRLSRPVAG